MALHAFLTACTGFSQNSGYPCIVKKSNISENSNGVDWNKTVTTGYTSVYFRIDEFASILQLHDRSDLQILHTTLSHNHRDSCVDSSVLGSSDIHGWNVV